MCTCSVGKDFFFFFCSTALLVQLTSQLSSCCYYRDTEGFIFGGGGLPDHFHSECAECLSALTVFPSLSAAELRVSLGSCFWPVVWQLRLALSAQPRLQPPSPPPLPSLQQPTHACPCWGHFRRTVGVTRSHTALNGPKQAVQINNKVRYRSSYREQQSVKCQQQTPSWNKEEKQQLEPHPLKRCRE